MDTHSRIAQYWGLGGSIQYCLTVSMDKLQRSAKDQAHTLRTLLLKISLYLALNIVPQSRSASLSSISKCVSAKTCWHSLAE